MTPDPRTEEIRTRRQAGNDDIGIAYSVPADEWHLTCDKPTMQMLKSAPGDLAYLLGRIEALTITRDHLHATLTALITTWRAESRHTGRTAGAYAAAMIDAADQLEQTIGGHHV